MKNILIKYQQGDKITPEDLKNSKTEDMDQLLNLVHTDLASITSRIAEANARRLIGQYSDPAWYSKITFSKRIKGQLSQILQKELSTKKKKEKKDAHELHEKTLLESLLIVMDSLLSPNMKKELMDRAMNLMKK